MKAEYLGMPGLCLTLDQAGERFDLEPIDCREIFNALCAAGFLAPTGRGFGRPNRDGVIAPASVRAFDVVVERRSRNWTVGTIDGPNRTFPTHASALRHARAHARRGRATVWLRVDGDLVKLPDEPAPSAARYDGGRSGHVRHRRSHPAHPGPSPR